MLSWFNTENLIHCFWLSWYMVQVLFYKFWAMESRRFFETLDSSEFRLTTRTSCYPHPGRWASLHTQEKLVKLKKSSDQVLSTKKTDSILFHLKMIWNDLFTGNDLLNGPNGLRISMLCDIVQHPYEMSTV